MNNQRPTPLKDLNEEQKYFREAASLLIKKISKYDESFFVSNVFSPSKIKAMIRYQARHCETEAEYSEILKIFQKLQKGEKISFSIFI